MIKLPSGFLLSGINCGLKQNKLDLGLIYCETQVEAVGFFTTSKNVSYSVTVSRNNIKNPIKAVLTNSGNANCFSHKQGLKDTEIITAKLAKLLKVNKKNILIASTGIIGKIMPKEKLISAFPKLINRLEANADNFAKSIMTTDTYKKIAYAKVNLGKEAHILGFAKGAGMISPNMATMFGFILTDVSLPKPVLKKISKEAIEESFNSITIDGCMSTNDTVFVLSSGKVKPKNAAEIELFSKKIKEVCLSLATMMVRDGEGATKFIKISVKGARTEAEAKKAGLYIANSNLFKCAVYGANPNWGRIIAAIGHAGIGVKEGIPVKMSDLTKKDIYIDVDLKRGKYSRTIYTSDLTPEYIKINAEYS
jgi:glutamate N-acetyltransferase/amino-acid N-acetyltransferase